MRTVDQEQPLKNENKGIFNKLTVEIKWSTKNTNLIQKKVGKEKNKTKTRWTNLKRNRKRVNLNQSILTMALSDTPFTKQIRLHQKTQMLYTRNPF